MASFFSNQGGGIREKYHFLFIMLTFYSKEVIKFYSTLKMSLLHADKVSCNLKQNQGVASLTNFCDAEPIKKNFSYGEDRRNYSKFVLSQIFRIRQATKRGEDSLEQKKFTTCKKLRLNFDLQSWLEILKFFLGAIFAIFSLASVFCRRASSKMSNHQSSYSANQNSSACRS